MVLFYTNTTHQIYSAFDVELNDFYKLIRVHFAHIYFYIIIIFYSHTRNKSPDMLVVVDTNAMWPYIHTANVLNFPNQKIKYIKNIDLIFLLQLNEMILWQETKKISRSFTKL